MKKKHKIAAAAGIIVWTLIIVALTGIYHRKEMRLLAEEKNYLALWIENRHGKEWAARVEDWARHKAENRHADK